MPVAATNRDKQNDADIVEEQPSKKVEEDPDDVMLVEKSKQEIEGVKSSKRKREVHDENAQSSKRGTFTQKEVFITLDD